MAQTLIKIDYEGLDCRGIYYVSDEIILSNVKPESTIISKDNAPKGVKHKFVIRQTVTISGYGF